MSNQLQFKPATQPIKTTTVVDKIAITFNVPDEKVRAKLVKAILECPIHLSTKTYKYFARFPLHEHNFKFLDPTKATDLQLSAEPKGKKKSKIRFAKVEFNPSRTPPEVVRFYLEQNFGVTWDLLLSGNLTALHVAVDLEGVDIEHLMFIGAKFKINKVFSADGKTEYIGGSASTLQFAIYNKAAEILQKNKMVPDFLKQPVPAGLRTRIEARLRPYAPFKSFLDMPNPFKKLMVGVLPQKDWFQWQYKIALDLAQLVGLTTVFAKLPDHPKEVLQGLLQKHQASWWSPDKVWSDFIASAKPLLNPVEPPSVYAYAKSMQPIAPDSAPAA